MKTVKYLFIVMAAMFVVTSASAQPQKSACKRGGETCVKESCSKIATTLQLTEQQSKQVLDIMTKYEKQNQAKREQIGKIYKELSDSRAAQKSEIEALLNPSQKAAYEQMASKHMQFERHTTRHDISKKTCVCKDCKDGCGKECVTACNKAIKGDCANATRECRKKR